MKLKMKNNFLLIKELDKEELTDSGIYIYEKYQRKAVVISCCESDNEICIGDIVLKNVGRGTELTIDGETFETIHKNFIMAVLKSS